MVLPTSYSAAIALIALSVICLALWPNLFKVAGKYRFELFSFDFALGAVVCAVIAAYTLGTMGAQLGFNDSMLVAGRRAELMAFLAGGVFALANMLYFATIALTGLTNGTLLSFSVMGVVLAFLQVVHSRFVTGGLGIVLFIPAAIFALMAIRQARGSNSKGMITGALAGLLFAGLWPTIKLAEPEQLGIGAYAGVLLAAFGILVSTFFYNFFFMNLSLEGGDIGFGDYFSSTVKQHVSGMVCGVVWVAGALALYAACTGAADITEFEGWLAPFAAALLAIASGMLFWQKSAQSAEVKKNKMISTGLFVVAMAVVLAGMR